MTTLLQSLRMRLRISGARGQATTEVVLLFPLFMFFLFAFAKTFALLVLVQKMEVASYYAARRWQLESHRNVRFESYDDGYLCHDIESKVKDYLGFNDKSAKSFLGLRSARICPVTRTQVWNVVTLRVKTQPVNVPLAVPPPPKVLSPPTQFVKSPLATPP